MFIFFLPMIFCIRLFVTQIDTQEMLKSEKQLAVIFLEICTIFRERPDLLIIIENLLTPS